MAWEHLVEVALWSPVLTVLITSAVGLFVGRQVLRAKDEQIKVKDQQIAALERWTAPKMQEHAEAMKRFWELRAEEQEREINGLQAKLEEDRNLSAQEREQVQELLIVAQEELAVRREAEQISVKAVTIATLEGELAELSTTLASLETQRVDVARIAAVQAGIHRRMPLSSKNQGETQPLLRKALMIDATIEVLRRRQDEVEARLAMERIGD